MDGYISNPGWTKNKVVKNPVIPGLCVNINIGMIYIHEIFYSVSFSSFESFQLKIAQKAKNITKLVYKRVLQVSSFKIVNFQFSEKQPF